MALAVEDDQAAGLGGGGRSIRGRQATHNHQAGTERDQSGGKSHSARTRPGKVSRLQLGKDLHVAMEEIWSIVVPVPCKSELALKLLTSSLPSFRLPAVWRTMATPYGFTSPLDGMVEPMVLMLLRF